MEASVEGERGRGRERGYRSLGPADAGLIALHVQGFDGGEGGLEGWVIHLKPQFRQAAPRSVPSIGQRCRKCEGRINQPTNPSLFLSLSHPLCLRLSQTLSFTLSLPTPLSPSLPPSLCRCLSLILSLPLPIFLAWARIPR